MENNSRHKVTAVFDFLQELMTINHHSVKKVNQYQWYEFLDVLPCDLKKIKINYATDLEDGNDNRVLLEVEKPQFSSCPKCPEILLDWIGTRNWDDFKVNDVQILKEKIVILKDDDKNIERFVDDSSRVLAYKMWIEKRNLWRKEELQKEKIQAIFDKFYDIYEDLKTDSEKIELMLGNGNFCITLNNDSHPILLKRVKMVYDKKNKMQVIDTDSRVELYGDMFNDLPYIRDDGIRELQKELSNSMIHPLNRNIGESFLQHIASMLSTKCRKIEYNEELLPSDFYVIYDRPVLFIRDKQSELKSVIKGIKEQVEKSGDIPVPLEKIVGYCPKEKTNVSTDGFVENVSENLYGESDDILLVKPANAEQVAIAKKIDKSPAVVVQGPPGTGKTHTIANLLGHFLAQGKHVLITSYTPKALSVLKEKLPNGIQNLCVSLVDDSRKDMEKSISGISEMYARCAAEDLRKQAEPIKNKRVALLRELSDKRRLLAKVLRMETDRDYFVFSGQSYSLSEMAKFVHDNNKADEIIPGVIADGRIIPISDDDIKFLYSSAGTFDKCSLNEMESGIPNIDGLMTPEEFIEWVKCFDDIKNRVNSICEELGVECAEGKIKNQSKIIADGFDEGCVELLEESYESLCLDQINSECIQRAICVGIQEGGYRKIWNKLNLDIEKLFSINEENIELMFGKSVNCPQIYMNDEQIFSTLDDIEHSLSKGAFSLITKIRHGKWVKTTNDITVNSSPIKTPIDCRVVKAYIKQRRQYGVVQKEWNQLLVPYGECEFGKLAETEDDIVSVGVKRWRKLNSFLDWYNEQYRPLLLVLEKAGLKPENMFDAKEYETDMEKINGVLNWLNVKLPAYLELCKAYYIDRISHEERLHNELRKFNEDGSILAMQFKESMENLNVKLYEALYGKLVKYHKQMGDFERRNDILNEIKKVAVNWAEKFNSQNEINEEIDVETVKRAWLCKQFKMQLDKVNKIDIEKIENDVVQLTEHLHVLTADLAEKLAWFHLLRNVSDENMQNRLVAWGKTMSKYGKGTGKNAALWMNKAKDLMIDVQKAVPAWIMPLNKVWANIKPDTEKFDIIIIDEASQVDITALPLLYFGKKIIIVGDDKQVSPSGIGIKHDDLINLQARTIKGEIDNAHLYTADTSLYDLAQMNFETKMLKEHFRCVPEIIGYCNNLSYDNQIKPLREAGEAIFRPVISYRVDGHRTNKKENFEEAEYIAALLLACINQPEYENKTFGAITMLGTEQALAIRQMVRERVDVSLLEKHEFLCGNSAQFQGDERDVIFLSLVDDNPGDGLLRTVTSGKGDETKKRYNVAVSRARDQLWIIHSMGIEDMKEDDIRRGLLEYAQNPGAYLQSMASIEEKSDSVFELEVAKSLVARGYHVIQQWKVGSYSIDMVVVYKGKRVAVECDGERWHSTDEQIVNDMKRQAVLERLGWRFIRIRGSEYFRAPSQCVESLIKKINSHDIYPETVVDENVVALKNELFDRVNRQATNFVREWHS